MTMNGQIKYTWIVVEDLLSAIAMVDILKNENEFLQSTRFDASLTQSRIKTRRISGIFNRNKRAATATELKKQNPIAKPDSA